MMAIVIVLAISLGAKFVQMVLSERQRRADRARRQQEEQAQMMRDMGRITARSRRRASSPAMLHLAVGATGILALAALKNKKGGAGHKVRVPGKPCTHCGTPVAIGAFHCEACGAPAPEDNR